MADFLASDEFCGDGTLGLQCWGNDLTVTDDFKRHPPPPLSLCPLSISTGAPFWPNSNHKVTGTQETCFELEVASSYF